MKFPEPASCTAGGQQAPQSAASPWSKLQRTKLAYNSQVFHKSYGKFVAEKTNMIHGATHRHARLFSERKLANLQNRLQHLASAPLAKLLASAAVRAMPGAPAIPAPRLHCLWLLDGIG